MSQSHIVRFPKGAAARRDNDPHAAAAARGRIAELPDLYLSHASPSQAAIEGGIVPVSPAAVASGVEPAASVAIPAAGGRKLRRSGAGGKDADADAADTSAATGPPDDNGSDGAGGADASKAGRGGGRRRLPSRLKPLVTGLVTFVLLFLVFKAPIFLSQITYFTHAKAPTTSSNQAASVVPAAPIINIPKISVNAPVVYATDNNENDILTDLQSGVVHYAGTAQPGQIGNSVIFGHSSNDWWEQGSYKFVFVLLDKLQPGDTFTVNYNSHQYLYQVTSTEVVDPTDVAVLAPTSDAEMTLITCTPPGTSWKRLIVHSKQISPSPSGTASAPESAKNIQTNGTLPSNSPGITDRISQWWHDLGHLFGGGGSSQNTTLQPGASPSGGSSGSGSGSGSGSSGSPTTIPDTQ